MKKKEIIKRKSLEVALAIVLCITIYYTCAGAWIFCRTFSLICNESTFSEIIDNVLSGFLNMLGASAFSVISIIISSALGDRKDA